MPRVVFASALARWIRPSSDAEMAFDVDGQTVRSALEHVFIRYPSVRGYVMDDRGRVRHHVAVFVDGESLHDKQSLDVALGPRSEVYVMQALSGG
jgi:molybdopterin synthase sulfur carrier subunit